MNSNRQYLALFQGLIMLFLFFNYVAHDISFSSVIRIFLYQFFAWFLAGRVIVSLFKIQVKNYAEMMALSYAFGAISALLIYLLFMLPGLGFLLPLFTVLEGAACTYYLYKKDSIINKCEIDSFGMWVCIVLLAIYFSFSFCAVSLVNSFPNETLGGTGYYADWPFWAGNNIAFTKGFPIDTFRQTGTIFKYHHFSSILMAHMSLCTGVDINWISFYFSSIFGGIILVLTAYYFSTRLVKTKWLIVVIMVVALFTDGTTVTYTWHTNICPFGFDYGFAFGMMSLALLVEILKNDRFEELFLPSCMYLAMTTGCKGPIGVVVLASYGAAAASYLIQRKFKRGFLSGICWLTSFFVVYLIFINSPGTFSTESGAQYIGGLGINTVITSARWVADIYSSLLSTYRIGGDHLLVKLYAVWLYIYRANKVVMTLLLIAIGMIIKDFLKKKYDNILYCLFTSSLAGIMLAIYITQAGGSQMYFMMGMFPSAIMAGGYALERINDEKQTKSGVSSLSLYRAVCIIMLFTLGISASQYYNTIMAKFREGVAVVRDTYTPEDYGAYYADSLDYDAFDWLKKNTPEDALIATDSHTDIYGRDNSMIMGMFSQRFIWNEYKYVPNADEATRRNEIVTAAMSNPDEYVFLMKEDGVDYLVYQIADGKAEYAAQCSLLSEVFRNNHYVVYKVE